MHPLYKYLIFISLAALLPVTGWAEGDSAPPLQLASPSLGSMPTANRTQSNCESNPCQAGCSQTATCLQYKAKGDECANPNQVMMGWTCNEPCSCSSDGTLTCSVSYRCADPKEALEASRSLHQPIKIELAIPFSGEFEEETGNPESDSESEENSELAIPTF